MRRSVALALGCAALALAACSSSFGGSCTVADDFFCLDYTGSGYATSDVRSACNLARSLRDGGAGTYDLGTCARTQLLGTCTRNPGTARETVEYDYDGGVRSAADFQALCSGGQWRVP